MTDPALRALDHSWLDCNCSRHIGDAAAEAAPLDVERLGFTDLLGIGEALLAHYPPDTIVCSHSIKADIGAQTAAGIADVIASCRAALAATSREEG